MLTMPTADPELQRTLSELNQILSVLRAIIREGASAIPVLPLAKGRRSPSFRSSQPPSLDPF